MRINTVLLILLVPPWGQLSGQAIQGQWLDAQSGLPILLAQVTLLVGPGQIVDQTYTDETGYFIVASEDPGSFFLRAERLGYGGRVDGIFDLGVGGLLTVEFRLLQSPIGLHTLAVVVERRDSTGPRCFGEGMSPRGWMRWCLHRTSPLSRSFGAPRRPPFNLVGPRVHVGSF